MSSLKNKIEHRLMRVLSDFKAMEVGAKSRADRNALTEICRRQADLLNWAMENLPDRRKTKPNDEADTF